MGLTVNVQKEYSADTDDTDGMEWPDVEPGYVIAVSPEAGSVAKSGDTVTLTVSRGLDWGEGALVPSVVGKTEEEAVTEFGKWLEINITKQQSADVPAGQVISQSPEAEETADPDEPASLVVSSGDQPPEAEPAADSSGAQTNADTSAQQQAAANGEVWKCTQSLNTPQDYKGGALRLELIQEVNGESEATTVVDGETLTFPYKLDITGSPGVSEGTLSVSEMINGEYQQLGTYPLTFEKAE